MSHLLLDLLVVQPVLASYRLPVFRKLSQRLTMRIVVSQAAADSGFANSHAQDLPVEWHKTIMLGPVHWQCGILSSLWQYHPRKFYFAANPRNLAIWPALLLCRLMGIRAYAHGQGAYDKMHPSLPARLMYRTLTALSTYYICYTELSMAAMLAMGCRANKLRVADNSITNEYPLPFQQKTCSGSGLLFIGRLREGCHLDMLLHSMPGLQKQHPRARLHIIGDGELSDHYRAIASNNPGIIFHGAIYDDKTISAIAQECVLGVYPGDAGLSIVHYMSLSLPPVVHADMQAHMGPEPSYINAGGNGLTFIRNDVEDLLRVMSDALSDRQALANMAANAWQTYEKLVHPDLGERLLAILCEGELPC